MGFRTFSQLTEQSWFRAGCASLLVLGAIGGTVLMQQQRLRQGIGALTTPQKQDQQAGIYLRSLKYLPSQGFGFNNLIAGTTFLRYLQYFGDEPARRETGYGLAPDFFDVITQRDPRFIESYTFAAGTLSYDLGRPEESMKVLDRGIAVLDPKLHAGAHRLWVLRAFDQLLLLGDAQAASESYRMGAQWSAQSPNREMRKDASILARYSKFLQTDPDSTSVRFWAWYAIFVQAKATGSEKTQSRARDELLLLGAVEAKNSDGLTIFQPPPPAPKPSPAAKPKPGSATKTAPAPKQPATAPAKQPQPSSQPTESSSAAAPDRATKSEEAAQPATSPTPVLKSSPTVKKKSVVPSTPKSPENPVVD